MKSKRISFLLKMIILAVVVYGTFTLVGMGKELAGLQNKVVSLNASITETQAENARIQDKITSVHTDEGIQDIARGELGLVAPGEIIFKEAGS